MSQAQSVSNLCFQRASEITNKLEGINNASKKFNHNGKDYNWVEGKPLPTDVKDLVLERALLHATQGFLMTHIKLKDRILSDLRSKRFTSENLPPEKPEMVYPELLPSVGEDWGWEQLSADESCELLEQEALAAHIGQFIHKGSVLAKLRAELPGIPVIEFIEMKEGEKTPVEVTPHHTPEQLHTLHEELASLHRKYESRVNYFKAKMKNLITLENARIAQENGVRQAEAKKVNDERMAEYQKQTSLWAEAIKVESHAFEKQRQEDIAATAALRIQVDHRFKKLVDEFLPETSNED